MGGKQRVLRPQVAYLFRGLGYACGRGPFFEGRIAVYAAQIVLHIQLTVTSKRALVGPCRRFGDDGMCVARD
jgi:hypothetical protein